VTDVAEREMLDGTIFIQHDAHPRRLIGNKHEIAERSEGALGNGVETGDLHVGRRPADAALAALVELHRRKRLATDLSRKVRAAGNDHFLTRHPDLHSS
jgi:hypothetical protein